MKISNEAYSDIRKFRFELNRDLKKWLKFYKNHPLIKTFLDNWSEVSKIGL